MWPCVPLYLMCQPALCCAWHAAEQISKTQQHKWCLASAGWWWVCSGLWVQAAISAWSSCLCKAFLSRHHPRTPIILLSKVFLTHERHPPPSGTASSSWHTLGCWCPLTIPWCLMPDVGRGTTTQQHSTHHTKALIEVMPGRVVRELLAGWELPL